MPPRPRRTSLRTCVVCQQPQPKKSLLRIVRSPEGEVSVDPTGKRPGRGAYVCDRIDCRTGKRAAQQLSRALRHPVTDTDLAGWLGAPGVEPAQATPGH